QGFSGLADLRGAIGDTRPSASASERRRKLAGGLEAGLAPVPPDHPRSVLAPLEDAEQKASEPELAALLPDACDAVAKRPALESCPVCEQPVDATDLASRPRARIAVLDDVKRVGAEASELGAAWRGFLASLEELEQLAADADATRGQPSTVTGRALLEELAAQAGDHLSTTVLARLETVRSALRAAHDAIPDDARAEQIGQLAKSIDAALDARTEIEKAESVIATSTRAAERLRAVHKAVSDARKDVAEEIHAEIEGLVRSFYARIHPPDQA